MPADTQDRAAIIAQAIANGYRKTSEATGIPQPTLRTWVARHNSAPKRPIAKAKQAETALKQNETQALKKQDEHTEVTLSLQQAETVPRARDNQGDKFLAKLRLKLDQCLDAIEPDPDFPHRTAGALQKIEVAGRIPYGYGEPGRCGNGSMINVSIHTDRAAGQVIDIEEVEEEQDVEPLALPNASTSPTE